MLTKWLANRTELLNHSGVLWGLRMLILAISLLAAAFLNTGVPLAEPGWGGVGG